MISVKNVTRVAIMAAMVCLSLASAASPGSPISLGPHGMKRRRAKKTHLIFGAFLGAALALVGPLAGEGRGDFILNGNEQLTVTVSHDNGTLWDMSRAFIASGGSVSYIDAHNSSGVDISDGLVACLIAYNDSSVDISGGLVGGLRAYNNSSVDISSGSVSNYLIANDNSSVHVSGGSVYEYLSAGDSSSVHISGGSLSQLSANTSGSVDISGGSVGGLGTIGTSSADITGGSVYCVTADYSSSVDISGGSVDWLNALFTSTVTFHGQRLCPRHGAYAGRRPRAGHGHPERRMDGWQALDGGDLHQQLRGDHPGHPRAGHACTAGRRRAGATPPP